MVKKSLQKWVYARMHKHSVGAKWQVENQQVISRNSVPFFSWNHSMKLQMLSWESTEHSI